MPLPRFERLPPERRRALLDAALEEFSAHGFEGASFNRIIERAGTSKGAIYYYFADKEDLYLSVVEDAVAQVAPQIPAFGPVGSTAAFWREVAQLYRGIIALVRANPLRAGLLARSAPEFEQLLQAPRLGPTLEAARRAMRRVLAAGKRVGAVRRDLPEALLIELVFAVGQVSDRWMASSGELASDEGAEQAVRRGVDLLRRVTAPA